MTASTAAGPAIEGQQITCGMLATAGAISDLEPDMPLTVLEDDRSTRLIGLRIKTERNGS